MADPRFFDRAGPYSLAELAQIGGAEIAGDADPASMFIDVAPLETATAEQVSFLDNTLYVGAFAASAAGACLVKPQYTAKAPAGMALLVSSDPYRAYARIARAFYPETGAAEGISPGAHVDSGATIGQGASVAAGALVGPGAVIGADCRIGPNAVIGRGVVLGDRCEIGANASLMCCLIGQRVIIHPGVRIGQDGFGFALGGQGHLKVPQLGRVIVEDDVEIGANTTIDRGTGPDTVIGAGSKIDNLVQIGHNVRLGRGCVIVAQVGISGSTKAGDFVMMGGQAGLAGHLSIGSGAKIAAKAGVFRDVPAGMTIAGYPGLPAKEHWRQVAVLSKLARGKNV